MYFGDKFKQLSVLHPVSLNTARGQLRGTSFLFDRVWGSSHWEQKRAQFYWNSDCACTLACLVYTFTHGKGKKVPTTSVQVRNWPLNNSNVPHLLLFSVSPPVTTKPLPLTFHEFLASTLSRKISMYVYNWHQNGSHVYKKVWCSFFLIPRINSLDRPECFICASEFTKRSSVSVTIVQCLNTQTEIKHPKGNGSDGDGRCFVMSAHEVKPWVNHKTGQNWLHSVYMCNTSIGCPAQQQKFAFHLRVQSRICSGQAIGRGKQFPFARETIYHWSSNLYYFPPFSKAAKWKSDWTHLLTLSRSTVQKEPTQRLWDFNAFTASK